MTDELDDELKALAAEYTLGLLSPAEARAFQDLLVTDPDLRDSYALWAEDFASLTDNLPEVAPPPGLLKSIEAELFGAAASAGKRSWLERLGLLPAALTGAVLAAIVLLVVDFSPGTPDFVPEYTAQMTTEDQSFLILAAFDADSGTLRLDRQAGAAAEGRSMELWIIAPDAAPVSLGVLADGATTEVTVPADLIPAFNGGTLAITDEPLGGSPSGDPTGAILAAGAVTSV